MGTPPAEHPTFALVCLAIDRAGLVPTLAVGYPAAICGGARGSRREGVCAQCDAEGNNTAAILSVTVAGCSRPVGMDAAWVPHAQLHRHDWGTAMADRERRCSGGSARCWVADGRRNTPGLAISTSLVDLWRGNSGRRNRRVYPRVMGRPGTGQCGGYGCSHDNGLRPVHPAAGDPL